MNERLAEIRALVAALPDPEIPVVTLEDLGILRGVALEDGTPVVRLTPTYTGCPATEAIVAQARATLDAAGFADAQIRIELSPPWTTDWIGPAAREKLRAWGIAPPACASACHPPGKPACPRCGSDTVECVSRWGSTPCKALYRCLACREPFDHLKPY